MQSRTKVTKDEARRNTTVGELAAFITRAKQALSEAGRPDLANSAVVVITEDGGIKLSFPSTDRSGTPPPEALRFMEIDPLFEYGGPR